MGFLNLLGLPSVWNCITPLNLSGFYFVLFALCWPQTDTFRMVLAGCLGMRYVRFGIKVHMLCSCHTEKSMSVWGFCFISNQVQVWGKTGPCVCVYTGTCVTYASQHIWIWKWFKSICKRLRVHMLFWPEISGDPQRFCGSKCHHLLEEIGAFIAGLSWNKFVPVAPPSSEWF